MLVMKMRSSSPANRPAKRIYVHVQKSAIYSRLSPATGEGRLAMVIVQKKDVFISSRSIKLIYALFYRIIL